MQFIAVHCHIPIVHFDMTMTIHFNLSRRRTLVTILLRGILFLPPHVILFHLRLLNAICLKSNTN